MTDKRTAEIAERAAAELLAEGGFERGVGEVDATGSESALQAFAWELGDGRTTGWTYKRGLTALVDRAIQIDRAQRPTLTVDERDITVGVWPAHPDLAADGGPEAIVVQIDTGHKTGRLRVNVNDAPVWDGDPEKDRAPGAHYATDPVVQQHNVNVARSASTRLPGGF